MFIAYKILYGSSAYGTRTEKSDIDIRGIYIPTIQECLSLRDLKDVVVNNDEEDTTIYPLQKFFKLAMKGNPSVLEWLFVPEDCILVSSPAAEWLRRDRKAFLSKELYYRFLGFATSEFASLDKMGHNIGAKRKEEVLKYGYSPKNAMNLVRLLEEGIELLHYGTITFPRPNARLLLEIKEGKWTYDEIKRMYFYLCDAFARIKEYSLLPEKVDFDKLDNMMITILQKCAAEG